MNAITQGLLPCPMCGCTDYIIHAERLDASYIQCANCYMGVR